MPIDHLGRRTISPTSNRYNKLYQKSTLNLTLLVLLVWGLYLNAAHRQTTSKSNQGHVITTNYSVVKYVGNISHVPTNDCLVQLGHIRDIKLYSQNDEDGALLQLLRCMGGHGTKEYFEFGSESGVEVNTRILRELYDWHGHLLDGGYEDPSIPLHKEYFTPSNIVSLLQKYKVNKNLDVLSIDTDYDDLWIMREILVAGYKPRILITEYNCNFGYEWAVSTAMKPIGKEEDIHWAGDCYFGASASAFIKLAKVFGYTPVWSNTVNLMWVRIDQAIELNMIIPSIESFPGPYTRLLHRDCNDKTWKLIDDSNIAKATVNSIPHEAFASGFADIKMIGKTYQNQHGGKQWRVFEEAK